MSEHVPNPRPEDVLTLEMAATYLHVAPQALQKLAETGGIPAQQIDGEWRFLRLAIMDWLGASHRSHPAGQEVLFEHPFFQDWASQIEKRLLKQLQQRTNASSDPTPGSYEAIMKRLGNFHADNDMEEMLARLRGYRLETDAE